MHTHLVDQEQTENIAEPLLLTTAAYQAYRSALAHARADFLEAGFAQRARDVGTRRVLSGDVAPRDADRRAEAWCPGRRACRWPGAYITIPGGGGEITGIAADAEAASTRCAWAWWSTPPTPGKAANILAHNADFLEADRHRGCPDRRHRAGPRGRTGGRDARRCVNEACPGRWNLRHLPAHGAEARSRPRRAACARSSTPGRWTTRPSLRTGQGVVHRWPTSMTATGSTPTAQGPRLVPLRRLRKNFETTEAQRQGFRQGGQGRGHDRLW